MAFGIICEYNPFHNGHLHQIKEIRKISDEPIICVMSGSFTQRGEAAITDKYTRARMALLCGADLVLELPVPYCFSSAEYFARAGVRILDSVGVNALCFGSECADGERLYRIAKAAASDAFREKCRELAKGEGTAEGYFELLAQESGEKNLSSNDILGVEYCKAIISTASSMQVLPIKRNGAEYAEKNLTPGENPSATALRECILHSELEKISEFVPQTTLDILRSAEIASLNNASDAILLGLRLLPGSTTDAVRDAGLVNRIRDTARATTNYDLLMREVGTKKYTRSALNRAVLYLVLGVTQKDLDAFPAYTTLLGANAKGREYLAKVRKNSMPIPVITKPADAYALCGAERQIELCERVESLYTLCFENKKQASAYFKCSPVII